MQFTTLMVLIGVLCLFSGCDSGGSGKKQDNDNEPHPNQNVPVEEIVPGPDNSGIPSDRFEEYQAYVQQTIHLRQPYNNVYEVALLTDQGEDLHYIAIDAEGNVRAFNYLGDTVDDGADCFRPAGGSEPNSALTGKKIIHYDFQFEQGVSDYGIALAGAGVDGRLASITWHQNNLGFLNKITIDSGAGTSGIKTLDNAANLLLEHHWDSNGRNVNLEIPITPDATITREYIQQHRCDNQTAGLYVTDVPDPDVPDELLYQGFLYLDSNHLVATYTYNTPSSCYQKNAIGMNEYLIDKTFRFDGLSNSLVIETPQVPDTDLRARLELNMDVSQTITAITYVEYRLVDGFQNETTRLHSADGINTVMLLPAWGEISLSTAKSEETVESVELNLCGS